MQEEPTQQDTHESCTWDQPRLFAGQTQHFTILKNPTCDFFLKFLEEFLPGQKTLVIKYEIIKIDSKGEKLQLKICNKI